MRYEHVTYNNFCPSAQPGITEQTQQNCRRCGRRIQPVEGKTPGQSITLALEQALEWANREQPVNDPELHELYDIWNRK